MLISPEVMIYFITGDIFNVKHIINLLKLHGINLSNSERKSFENAFSGKHKPSSTTISGIKNHFKKMDNDKYHHHLIDEIDFHSETQISEFSFMESCWINFFSGIKISVERRGEIYKEDFLDSEIKYILSLLNGIIPLVKERAADNIIENYINSHKLLIDISFCADDFIITIDSQKIINKTFSLNLMLYFIACIDVKDYSQSSFYNLIINEMLSDIESDKTLKSPFAYHTNLFKNNSLISFNKMIEELDISDRVFKFYRSGSRNIEKKHINVILNAFGYSYYIVVFLRNFLNMFMFLTKHKGEVRADDLIKKSFRKYPDFYKIAQLRFEEYKKS